MNFKCKLSHRLARLRVMFAAGVILALACTQDLTDPQSPHNLQTQAVTSPDSVPLAEVSVWDADHAAQMHRRVLGEDFLNLAG